MLDIIHIDPWKSLGFEDSIQYTVDLMERCSNINNRCLFEIGTEEAIFPMTTEMLEELIRKVKELSSHYPKIIYAVIQSGTSLKSGINTGNYDRNRLIKMIKICSDNGLLSKEHNGDYLEPKQMKEKFELGLSAINIAPEVAHIETELILDRLSPKKKQMWFALCLEQGSWKKWFPENYDPDANKYEVIRLCGHYVLSRPEFKKIYDISQVSEDVIKDVKNFIKKRVP